MTIEAQLRNLIDSAARPIEIDELTQRLEHPTPDRGSHVRRRLVVPAVVAVVAVIVAAVFFTVRNRDSDEIRTAQETTPVTGPSSESSTSSVDPMPVSAVPLLWPGFLPGGFTVTDAEIGFTHTNGVVAVAAHTDTSGDQQPLVIQISPSPQSGALPSPSVAQFDVGGRAATVQLRQSDPFPDIWDITIEEPDRVIVASIVADGTTVDDLAAFFNAIDIAVDGITTWRTTPVAGWQIIATENYIATVDPLPANVLEAHDQNGNALTITVTSAPVVWNWVSLIDGPVRSVSVGSTTGWIVGHKLLLITPDYSVVVDGGSTLNDDDLVAIAASLRPVTPEQHARFATEPEPVTPADTTNPDQLPDANSPRDDILSPIPADLQSCFPNAANPELPESTFSGAAPYLPDDQASLMILDQRGDTAILDANTVTWRRNQGYSWASLYGGNQVVASRITDSSVVLERLTPFGADPVASYPFQRTGAPGSACPISGVLPEIDVTGSGTLTIAARTTDSDCPPGVDPVTTDQETSDTVALGCSPDGYTNFERRTLDQPETATPPFLRMASPNSATLPRIAGEGDADGSLPTLISGGTVITGPASTGCCDRRPYLLAAITDTTHQIAHTDDGTTLQITDSNNRANDRTLWTSPDPIQALAANDTAIAVAHANHITIIDIATGTPYDIAGLQLNGIITIGYR